MPSASPTPICIRAFSSAPNEERLGSFQERIDRSGNSRSIFCFSESIGPSDAAAQACRAALELNQTSVADIDWVLSASQTPDFNNPGLVSLLLHKLGLTGTPGLEIRQVGVGSLYAIDAAVQLIRSGEARTVLVSCTDFLSRFFGDVDDPKRLGDAAHEAFVTFGDASVAFVVQAEEAVHSGAGVSFRCEAARLEKYSGMQADFGCRLPAALQFPLRCTKEDVLEGRHYPELNAAALFEKLAPRLTEEIGGFLGDQRIALDSIRRIVLHQIIPGLSNALSDRLSCDHDRFLDVFLQRGFNGAAGIPRALLEASERGELTSGDRALLVGATSEASFGLTLVQVC